MIFHYQVFLTPPNGTVSFELGVVAHDGDRAQQGDQLEFNGAGSFVNISDPIHAVNNVFNSTISNGGVITPFRNPSYNNTLGHDANIYAPDNSTFNYIGNGATSSIIRISTNSETVLTSVITSSIDIYEPELQASVSYQDLNGGTVLPGDILEYTIVSKNLGSDVSVNTYLIDTLDQRLTYISGTMEITYGPNSGVKTDQIDYDQAEFVVADNVIQARIGTGANGTTGGVLVNSPSGSDSTVLTFQVQLLDDCTVWQCGESLKNSVYLFGVGQTSGNLNSNDGVSDALDAGGCPSFETGNVSVDLSNCTVFTINYTDSLCVGDTLLFNFIDSPYLNYLWSGPNGFTSIISSPSIPNVQLNNSGVYTWQVTYSGINCLEDSIASVFVSANPTIQLNNIINADCFNSSTGLIAISGIGNGEINYEWSNNDQDSIAEELGAGVYSVIVTDQFGCTISDTFSVSEPPDILLTETSINPSCQGGTQGSIDLSVSGGTPDYSYSWNNNQTIQDINGLYAGQYVVFVTDSNGCVDSLVIHLNDPDALILSETHTNVLCYGNNTAMIDLTVSNGVQNYTYLWSDGQIIEDAFNLSNGNYFVNVIDQNNCGAFLSVFITQPDTLIFVTSSDITNVFCYGNSNGQIDLDIDGGVAPYSCLWNNGATTLDLSNLSANNYTLNVIDANGCVFYYSDTVSQPDSLFVLEIHGDVLCFGDSTGFIDITTMGGVSPFFYSWDTGSSSEDISSIPVGNYMLTTTDINNCSCTMNIEIGTLLGIDECVKLEMPNVFTPNNDLVNDNFIPVEIKNVQSINLIIMNRWGQTVFESDKLNFMWDGTWKGQECVEGVYFYLIKYTDNYSRSWTIHGNVSLER